MSTKSNLLKEIKENIEKNENKWDLTDDKGESTILVFFTDLCIPVHDLSIGGDGTPCLLVPLEHFSEKELFNILNKMK